MLNRRQFIVTLAAYSAVGGCVAGGQPPLPVSPPKPLSRQGSIAAWRKRIEAILDRGDLPIIDTEATYGRRINLEFILREMEHNDIAQIAFAPLFNIFSGSGDSLQLHQMYPAYFIPTTSDGVTRDWIDAHGRAEFFETVTKEVRSNAYFLMGEHEIRHYPSPRQYRAGRFDRDVTIPIEDRYVEGLFRFSEETGTGFQIHYEIEDQLLPPLEAMLARYPNARVVWCHLGQIRFPERSSVYGPNYVRSLIDRFPNLHFDLAVGGPGSTYPGSGRLQSTIFEYSGDGAYGGFLKGKWRTLLNEHPERFLAASDIGVDRFRNLGRNIKRLRSLILDELTKTAQHKIAYQNAWRLITKQQWQS